MKMKDAKTSLPQIYSSVLDEDDDVLCYIRHKFYDIFSRVYFLKKCIY